MKDEKPIDLRDQFAIEAMSAIIIARGDAPAYDYINERAFEITDFQIEKMERIAIVAYKMADAMRRVRLKAFD